MLILRDALGGWRPGHGAGNDPLGTANACWAEIVGEAMGKATRPVALEGEILVVRTTSAAWSHELSFHAERIVAALRARLPGIAIASLRIRTGLVSARPKSTRRGRDVRVTPRAELGLPTSPAEDLAAAVERLRIRQRAERDAKRRAGWKDCSRCGVSVASGAFCAPCAAVTTDARSLAAARIMYDAPWLGFTGTAELVPALTLSEYEATRLALLTRWWDRLVRVRARGAAAVDGTARSVASSFILLKTNMEPERITPAVAKNELGDALYALLYDNEAKRA